MFKLPKTQGERQADTDKETGITGPAGRNTRRYGVSDACRYPRGVLCQLLEICENAGAGCRGWSYSAFLRLMASVAIALSGNAAIVLEGAFVA